MLTPRMKKFFLTVLVHRIIARRKAVCLILAHMLMSNNERVRRRRAGYKAYDLLSKIPTQMRTLNRLYNVTDADCISNLRMDRNAFGRLCILLREVGGLTTKRYVGVEEQVAMFLCVLSHNKKQRVLKFDYERSIETVNRYVHLVLKAIIRLHPVLLVVPTLIPEDSEHPRWKWFKGCLGALDGTYIDVHVGPADKPRYRTRKGRVSTNVLGVCDHDMRFVYFLPGWEGSAADSRILRDAVCRPNGLKVPRGNYYLCDNGYANSEGFLTPYRGCRYHLKDWGPASDRPTNHREHFNMRHTRARNVIERAFGVLKIRFGMLTSPSYYPIKTQTRLIMCCFLLHNFCRMFMAVDPMEELAEEEPADENDAEADMIDCVDSGNEWSVWRDELAVSMHDTWRAARG